MWFQEESKFVLLMLKGEALQRANVSTRIIGVAQMGQRKITDWAGEDLVGAVM